MNPEPTRDELLAELVRLNRQQTGLQQQSAQRRAVRHDGYKVAALWCAALLVAAIILTVFGLIITS